MKIETEIIILHDNVKMPHESAFCPSFWSAEDFDSEGNFYWNHINDFWTHLVITKKSVGNKDSKFILHVFKEGEIFSSWPRDMDEAKFFLDAAKENHLHDYPDFLSIENLCMSSLMISTFSIEDYMEYLRTVHSYLEHMQGIAILPLGEFNGKEFKMEFID